MRIISTFLVCLLMTASATAGGPGASPGAADASAQPAETTAVVKEDYLRKTVITVEGDEIGVIRDVGYIASAAEAVAVVDIDAYIGIGEKRIVIPLSRFDPSDANSHSLTTLLTRQDIEAAEELSEADFTPAE